MYLMINKRLGECVIEARGVEYLDQVRLQSNRGNDQFYEDVK